MFRDNRGLRFTVRRPWLAHFFYFTEDNMGKKVSKKDVKEFMIEIVNQINDELDNDFADLHEKMMVLEFKLVSTFNEKQQKMYEEFCKVRDKFNDLAKHLYERKRPKTSNDN